MNPGHRYKPHPADESFERDHPRPAAPEPCQNYSSDVLLEWLEARYGDPTGEPLDSLRISYLTGIDRRTVHRWRAEEPSSVYFHTADRIATELGVHPEAIWGTDFGHAEIARSLRTIESKEWRKLRRKARAAWDRRARSAVPA